MSVCVSKVTKDFWAEHQPKDGDLILVCGHERQSTYHWFIMNPGDDRQPQFSEFTRPDGTKGEAKWGCICEDCLMKDSNPQAHIRSERIWIGDEPSIRPPQWGIQ